MIAKSIMIAIPALDQQVNIYLTSWLTRLSARSADPSHPHKYQFIFLPGVFPVMYARNQIANTFLGSTATHLFFLDADQIPLEGCEQMFDLDQDLVTGTTYILTQNGPRYIMLGNAFEHVTDEREMFRPGIPNPPAEVFEADATGTGCLLVARRVFEDERMVVATCEDKKSPKVFFDMKLQPTGEVKLGEDIGFTWRAKQLGYSVVLDGRSRFDHSKTIGLGALLSYAEDKCASLSSILKQQASLQPTDDSSVLVSSSKTSETSELSAPEPSKTNDLP